MTTQSRALSGLLALSLCACATTSESPAPPVAESALPVAQPAAQTPVRAYEAPAVVALRESVRALVEVQSLAVWKSWTTGHTVDLSESYAESGELFTRETVELVRSARDAASGEDAKALGRLLLYLAGEVLASETAAISSEIEKFESSARIELQGRSLHWQQLDALLASEPSSALRARAFESQAEIVRSLTPLYLERRARLEAAARALGWDSLTEYALELRDMDREGLRALAESTLEASRALYSARLEDISQRELALPLSKLRRADLPRLLRFGQAEEVFSAEDSIPSALSILKDLGFDLARTPGLTLETGREPERQARPLCVPVSAPEDVRVSLRPMAGIASLRLQTAELACAASTSSMRVDHWELRQFPPAVLGETWAALLTAPTRTPAWLGEKAPAQLETLLCEGAARRLHALRLDAARVLFALQDQVGDETERWRQLASRTTQFEFTPEEASLWALDTEHWLESADRLVGSLAAAQLERGFMEAHSALWWKTSAVAEKLRALWARGGAHRIELAGLSPDALVQTLVEQLEQGNYCDSSTTTDRR